MEKSVGDFCSGPFGKRTSWLYVRLTYEWARKLIERCGSSPGASLSARRRTPPRLGCCASAGPAAMSMASSIIRDPDRAVRRAMSAPPRLRGYLVLTILSQSSAYCCLYWGQIFSSATLRNEATSAWLTFMPLASLNEKLVFVGGVLEDHHVTALGM